MRHQVYRHRRRLCLFLFGICLIAFQILLSVRPILIPGDWIYNLMTLHIVGAVIGIGAMPFILGALAIIRFKPTWRNNLEFFPIWILVGFGLSKIDHLWTDIPVLATYPVLTFCAMAWIVIKAASKLPRMRLFQLKAQASYTSHKSAQAIWSTLYPSPQTRPTFWRPGVVDIKADPTDPTKCTVIVDYGTGPKTEYCQFHTQNAPSDFTYDEYDDDSATPLERHTCRIIDHGTHREVILSLHVHALAPVTRLALWADDYLGQKIDHLFACETGDEDSSLFALIETVIAERRAKATPRAA